MYVCFYAKTIQISKNIFKLLFYQRGSVFKCPPDLSEMEVSRGKQSVMERHTQWSSITMATHHCMCARVCVRYGMVNLLFLWTRMAELTLKLLLDILGKVILPLLALLAPLTFSMLRAGES